MGTKERKKVTEANEVLDLVNKGFVAESLEKILKMDFQAIADENPIVAEALATIEGGTWPKELLTSLMSVLEELAEEYQFDFHHFGFLQPDRKTWDEATANYEGDIVRNDLIDPKGHKHLRKYIRVNTGGKDVFLEYALFGEGGDGRLSVHFDLIHEKAAEMLAAVKERLQAEAERLGGASVFESNFGGGNAPVGRIGINFDKDKTIDVGVMFRTHHSDPASW